MASRSHTSPASAIARHRQRLQEQGLQRVEVHIHGRDAALLRSIAAALIDPGRAEDMRSMLLARVSPVPARSLKDILASAPLEGIELDRGATSGGWSIFELAS